MQGKTYNDKFDPTEYGDPGSDSLVAQTLDEIGAPPDTPAPAKPKNGKKLVREGGKKVETPAIPASRILQLNLEQKTFLDVTEMDLRQVLADTYGRTGYEVVRVTPIEFEITIKN